MGSYVLTGGATGIGAAVKEQLLALGHEVLVVDLQNADINADLGTIAGREHALEQIRQRLGNGCDGLITCAGLGPHVRPLALISRVNYFGSVALVIGLQDLLAKKQGAVVMVSSNSAPMPADQTYIDLLLAGDEDGACARIETLDGHNAYAGSKNALSRWMRRQSPAFAQQRVRLNAVAPGITRTPLTDAVMGDVELGPVIKAFGDTVPLGHIGKPEEIAGAIVFLLSPAASFVHGSILFVDGGHDALMRPDQF